ncbi:MAG: mannose-1-phosphate guanylyltransferase/mannose-6-phosphate isomerase [Hyphomonadaceae bacterium]|nr:mannose-1-phosphate guanylyltransferase/mannose-6-phosphate isomerase [Hyphomonadaceae bacterium]
MTNLIVPAILCGGSGTRLWPLSRRLRPKQFHALTSDATLLSETVARTAHVSGAVSPVLIAGEHMREIAVAEAPHGARIVLEPQGRNTAPAAALAALDALRLDEDAIVLMLPSDHHVGDDHAFADAMRKGAALAADRRLVTFGIAPDTPHTGFGYITAGEPLGEGFIVARFVEKPLLPVAEALLAAGGATWNSGIYMFAARFYLDELARFAPAIRLQAEAAWSGGSDAGCVRTLDAAAWALCPSDSIDYAVAEKTDRAAVVPVSMSWSDVGSWAALHDIGRPDERGNVVRGDVIAVDSARCYVRADGRLVALVGVEDLVVVETADAVLVMPRARAQDVKSIVEALKARGRTDLL